MSKITYVEGDATLPQSPKPTVIAHSCNDLGVFGAGFVVPLGKRYPTVRELYLQWAREKKLDEIPFQLGQVQFVKVEDPTGLWVANMVGQKGIGFRRGPPVRYEALHEAFGRVAKFAKKQEADVVMPRVGCSLGGGKWEIVEKLIEQTLIKAEISVFVCDLPKNIEDKNDGQPVFGW